MCRSIVTENGAERQRSSLCCVGGVSCNQGAAARRWGHPGFRCCGHLGRHPRNTFPSTCARALVLMRRCHPNVSLPQKTQVVRARSEKSLPSPCRGLNRVSMASLPIQRIQMVSRWHTRTLRWLVTSAIGQCSSQIL